MIIEYLEPQGPGLNASKRDYTMVDGGNLAPPSANAPTVLP